GEYPRDQQEQRSWKLTGKQPNSVLIGGQWVSFNKFGPAGDLAALASNLGTIIPRLQKEDDGAMLKATWGMVTAAINVIKDEVGFLSLAMLYDAITDDKKGARWVANQAATTVPFSSMLAQSAAIMDPSMREVKNILDGIKYKVPYARET